MFKSKCCKADVKWVMAHVSPKDDPKRMNIGTCWLLCEKCGKNCDADIDPALNRKDEWKLTIIRKDNGYYLTGTDSDIMLQADDKDPLDHHMALLYEVMEYFNFFGSKHDPERIRITREKQKKCKTIKS